MGPPQGAEADGVRHLMTQSTFHTCQVSRVAQETPDLDRFLSLYNCHENFPEIKIFVRDLATLTKKQLNLL